MIVSYDWFRRDARRDPHLERGREPKLRDDVDDVVRRRVHRAVRRELRPEHRLRLRGAGGVRDVCSVPEGVRVPRGVVVKHVRSGVFSLLVAGAFLGYGVFRYHERPVLGIVLVVVGLLNVLVSVASFGLAVWGEK